jgi:transposase InsO family protein
MGLSLTTAVATAATPAQPPPPKGIGWLDVGTAAARLGQDAGHVGRRCRSEWVNAGMAELRAPVDGGKRQWYVREDADPKLGRVISPQHIRFDPRALSGKARQRMLTKKALLDEWEAALSAGVREGMIAGQVTEEFVRAKLMLGFKPLSEKSLYRWKGDFAVEGIKGLADLQSLKGGGAGGAVSDADPFLEMARRLWLVPTKPTKKWAWQTAVYQANLNGWATKEYRTTVRYLEKIPLGVVIKCREGRDAYVAKAEPSIERDYSTMRSNEEWVGDHHQFDVMVKAVGGRICRPWLTAWQDMRSRKIVGWCIYAHDPNQNTVLSALRSGCLAEGVPERVYTDNGKDYDCYALHGRTKWKRHHCKVGDEDECRATGILAALGCKAKFCQPYHGQSKPIERFFGTLEDRFGKRWPTYCGNKPENKPENLEDRLKRGMAPDLAEFVATFEKWVEDDYNAAPHTGNDMEGRSPNAVFDSSWNGAAKRVADPLELLDVLLTKPIQPVKVTKNGIRWNGLGYGQYTELTIRWLGKEVFPRVDERDVTRLLVFGPDDKFICVAPVNDRIPANSTGQDVREAKKKIKRRLREINDYVGDNRGPRIALDLPQQMVQQAAARRRQREAENPEPPGEGPGSIKPIQSPLATPAVLRQLGRGLKRAVGAESMSPRKSFLEEMAPFRAQAAQEEANRLAEIQSRDDAERAFRESMSLRYETLTAEPEPSPYSGFRYQRPPRMARPRSPS